MSLASSTRLRFFRSLAPAVALGALLAAPAAASTPKSDFADEAFTRVNSQRTQAGLPALSRMRGAELAAQLHAMDMANREYMDHYTKPATGPVTPDPQGFPGLQFTSGMDPSDRLDVVGYDTSGWGENVAWNSGFGASSPADAVQRWMNSTGHRENILRPQFKGAGMGCAVSASGKVYYAQTFVWSTGGEETLARNADLWSSPPGGGGGGADTTAPGSWSGFTVLQNGSAGPSFRINARDGGSGLDTATAQFRYSTTGGKSWSAWMATSISGGTGTTQTETLSTSAVRITQTSKKNRVQFRVTDIAGNTGTSSVLTVPKRK
jgi:uncharacterized protein YkwD